MGATNVLYEATGTKEHSISKIMSKTGICHFMNRTVSVNTYKVYEWVMAEAHNAAAGYREFDEYESMVEEMVRRWVTEHIEYDSDYASDEAYALPILCAYGHASNAVYGVNQDRYPFHMFVQDIIDNALLIIGS